jgi:hypothetical protein
MPLWSIELLAEFNNLFPDVVTTGIGSMWPLERPFAERE